MYPTQLAVVDLETTGLDKRRDRILEFGLVLLSLPGLGVIRAGYGVVDPSKHPFDEIKFTDADWNDHSTQEALKVNGLSREYCAQHGLAPDEMLHRQMDTIDWSTTVLAGWGIDFDAGILEHEYKLLGAPVPWSYRTFDIRSACNVPTLLLCEPSRTCYAGLGEFLDGVARSKMSDLLEQPDLDGWPTRRPVHDALADALSTVRALRILQFACLNPSFSDRRELASSVETH
jgi:DNA polymerase III epsilon subunit-like protein